MSGYRQFCPVAKTAELICDRWMPLILRELMCGGSRFGEIRRGLPAISPTLLAKRLRQLSVAGVVTRTESGAGVEYTLTPAGWELRPIIEAMGVWGQRWARSSYTPDELDPSFLMWDVRRFLRPTGLGDRRRTVVEIWFRPPVQRRTTYWLVVGEEVDLCLRDPGLDVDLRVNADLRALTMVWMGDITFAEALEAGLVEVLGSPRLAGAFAGWLGHHPTLGGVRRADAVTPG